MAHPQMNSLAPQAAADPPLYTAAGFVMIRAPLLPVEPLQTFFVRTAGEPPDAALAALGAVAANPLVAEALLVSSPVLGQAVRYLEQDPTGKKGRRAALSLLRYFVRMSTRPTPFGLLAGVAPGVIGPAMAVRLGPRAHYRTSTRPDLQWLLYQVRRLEDDPGLAAQLAFYPNPAMIQAGGRLHIPYRHGHGTGGAGAYGVAAGDPGGPAGAGAGAGQAAARRAGRAVAP